MSVQNRSDPGPAKGAVSVVAVGASAGGLAGMRQLLEAMPVDSGIAVVFAQHLAADQKSNLVDLLESHSSARVSEACDGDTLESNRVYIIPPDGFLRLQSGRIHIEPRAPGQRAPMSIDYLFDSCAAEFGPRAIGILLSGNGSDGTIGLRAIKAAGGIAIAQDPREAGHSGMPGSAIEAGVVDLILPIAEMPKAVLDFINNPPPPVIQDLQISESSDELDELSGESFNLIRDSLRQATGLDVGLYKSGTIRRRIIRRMRITRRATMDDYAAFLSRNPEETGFLLHELMIGVTEFFRDSDAFNNLIKSALPPLLESLTPGQTFRVWVPGCSTGEEVYSLAMILTEALGARPGTNLQILASDLDDASLHMARGGLFPISIERSVPPKMLEKYFQRMNNLGYQIVQSLRDKVTFAHHNLLVDPPFSNIHLISCRNVLIYLRREVQDEVLKNFHFSLNPDGVLFLGTSESLGPQDQFFAPISKKWRLYRRVGTDVVVGRHFQLDGSGDPRSGRIARRQRSTEPSIRDVARVALLESCVPPSIIVDEQQRVLFLHGDLHRVLDLPKGEPRMDLASTLRPEIRARVEALFYRAQRQQSDGESTILVVTQNGRPVRVRATAKRIVPGLLSDNALAIVFEDAVDDATTIERSDAEIPSDGVNEELHRELISAREDLRTMVEELEASNEELKATNEEAMSMNEELQSANEELEVSAEELRSVNDELAAVNNRLVEKIEELERINDDLHNFFASTRLSTIFLDTQLRIKRASPAAASLLDIDRKSTLEPLSSLLGSALGLIDQRLVADCRKVLDDLSTLTREIQIEGGKWYQVTILPYRTNDNRIEGVVVNFIDITKLRTIADRLARRERQQTTVARLGLQAIHSVDLEVLFQEATRLISETLDVPLVKVLRLDEDKQSLTLLAGVGWGPTVTIGQSTVPTDLESQAGFTLRSGDPIIVNDLRKETRFSGPQLLRDANVISGISCVIQIGSEPYGVLGAHTTIQREFTREDTAFLQSVANVLAGAIRALHDQQRIQDQLNLIEAVYSTAPVGLAVIDANMKYVRVNDRLASMTGLPIEEHHGKSIRQVIPLFADLFEDTIAHVIDTRQSILGVVAEGETAADPGHTRVWINDFYPLLIEGQHPVVNVVTQDITTEQMSDRRMVAEHRLSQILAECESFDEAMPSAVQDFREALQVDVVEYWEALPGGTMFRMAEHALAEDADKSTRVFVAEGRKLRASQEIGLAGHIAAARAPQWFEYISKNPELLRNRESEAAGLRTAFGFPLISGGSVIGVMLFFSTGAWGEEPEFIDMMNRFSSDFVQFLRRVKAIKDLQTSEIVARRRHAEIDHIYRTLPIGLCFYDRDLRYLKINETLAAINGRPVDDHIGRTMIDVLPEELLTQIKPTFDRVLDTDEGAQIEVTAPLPSDPKQLRTWIVNIQPVRNDDELQGVNVVVMDITDRLKAEQEIREHEQRLRLATTASEVGIWSVDVENATVHWTPEVYRIAALDESGDLTIRQMREMVHPDELDFVSGEIEQALQPEAGGHIFFQTRIGRPSGEYRWVEIRGEVFFEQDGLGSHRPVRAIGTVIDITERIKAEEHQQLLVRELSHRVKNILATVSSIASQTKRQATSLDTFAAAFEGRLVAMGNVHGLLLRTEWRGASLRTIIEQTIAPYKSIHAKSLDIRGDNVVLTARAATVISLVFHELVTNAVKYGSMSQDGGRIRLHWTVDTDAEYGLIIEWEESGGPEVTKPKEFGFGTTLITDGVRFELDGKSEVEYRPEGIKCTIKLPSDVIQEIIPEPENEQ